MLAVSSFAAEKLTLNAVGSPRAVQREGSAGATCRVPPALLRLPPVLPVKQKKVKCGVCKFSEVVIGKDLQDATKLAHAKFGSPGMVCPQCKVKGRVSEMQLFDA